MSDTQSNEKQEVTIVDIKMPFMSMVIFLVKLAIASIPAFIILSVIFMIFGVLFGGVFHGMGMGVMGRY
ncbi:hypothetical protein [Psychromonas ingrahamii]|uniref:hypothetical protein n=1 Tax=Psychromonas ingrahamii TaxID=357794 RepID=UPI00030C0298|nr:hypothetical protein [Psychromonas ingrahamii]